MIRTLESLPYAYVILRDELDLTDDHQARRDHLTSGITLSQAQSIIPTTPILVEFHRSLTTKLYIYPGFTFHLIDGIITNFHIPRSSLLMIIAAYM